MNVIAVVRKVPHGGRGGPDEGAARLLLCLDQGTLHAGVLFELCLK